MPMSDQVHKREACAGVPSLCWPAATASDKWGGPGIDAPERPRRLALTMFDVLAAWALSKVGDGTCEPYRVLDSENPAYRAVVGEA